MLQTAVEGPDSALDNVSVAEVPAEMIALKGELV